MAKKLVLMNSYPAVLIPKTAWMRARELSVDELKKLVDEAEEIVHSIRHQGTWKLMESLITGKKVTYKEFITWEDLKNAIVVVISLKTPVRGQELQNLSISDLLILGIEYLVYG